MCGDRERARTRGNPRPATVRRPLGTRSVAVYAPRVSRGTLDAVSTDDTEHATPDEHSLPDVAGRPAGTVLASFLDPDPARGLDAEAAAGEIEVETTYGMHTALGALRVERMIDAVTATLGAGLGRETALAVLHGHAQRLLRDGHPEYSDTVVRETIGAALAGACEDAGVEVFTDAEIGETALLVSAFSVEVAIHATRRSLIDGFRATDDPQDTQSA